MIVGELDMKTEAAAATILENLFGRGFWRLLAARETNGGFWSVVFRENSGTVVASDQLFVVPSGPDVLTSALRSGRLMCMFSTDGNGWIQFGAPLGGWPDEYLDVTCAFGARLDLEDLAE